MTARTGQLDAFLHSAGWGDAQRRPLAGDASSRRYERLTQQTERAILMDAPIDCGENIKKFVSIAGVFAQNGLSTPKVLAQDAGQGFLLLEDFDDRIFARVIADDPTQEATLYAAAAECVTHIEALPPWKGLPIYGPAQLAKALQPAWDWYANPEVKSQFFDHYSLLETVFKEILGAPSTVVHRDFHTENLIWLPDREGVKRVGIIDFQDAMLCYAQYDLASLLRDARRDVSDELEAKTLAQYQSLTQGISPDFELRYRLLAVQRNLRILGLFVKLAQQDGKPGYLKLIPRVWGYLDKDLKAPGLEPLADIIRQDMPVPDAALLEGFAAS